MTPKFFKNLVEYGNVFLAVNEYAAAGVVKVRFVRNLDVLKCMMEDHQLARIYVHSILVQSSSKLNKILKKIPAFTHGASLDRARIPVIEVCSRLFKSSSYFKSTPRVS